MPATMFIAAGCVGRLDGFWWDQLERLILTPGDLPPTLRLEIRGQRHEYRVDATPLDLHDEETVPVAGRHRMTPPTARHEFFLTLYRLLRPLSDPERRRALADLTAWRGGAPPADSSASALSVSELQTLASRTLIEIGAHTLTHPQLSTLNDDDQRDEIQRSRVVLEETTGVRVVSFAYPYGGRSDYTADTVRLVRDCRVLERVFEFSRNREAVYRPVRGAAVSCGGL